MALVIAGWGVAQYPYLILPSERISGVAAGDATLRSFLVALPIGALILRGRGANRSRSTASHHEAVYVLSRRCEMRPNASSS